MSFPSPGSYYGLIDSETNFAIDVRPSKAIRYFVKGDISTSVYPFTSEQLNWLPVPEGFVSQVVSLDQGSVLFLYSTSEKIFKISTGNAPNINNINGSTSIEYPFYVKDATKLTIPVPSTASFSLSTFWTIVIIVIVFLIAFLVFLYFANRNKWFAS